MTDSCIFCKIVRGEFGTEFVGESERAVAFQDINPAAPVHLLVVPKEHLSALRDLDDPSLGGELLELARQVALDSGLTESGYRLISNDGAGAGQTVFHLHFHVLGGRPLSTAMG
ncbi:MAG: histidine triad nucleotide-binding protein [Thermomicrobiales bacterium]